MALFYFHRFDAEQTLDLEGFDLPTMLTAFTHARRDARILANECLRAHGRLFLGHRVEVCDDRGRKVMTVYYSDVVGADR